ncbi:TetR/AcrR family transcriptional regulator [Streptomyces hoynatensis]|uniref:TetR/AcrR family transcriptional regulator n=1 Tax=Streptomyces hoynatensis TaxID=1141874 RepID=A0A3A9ZG25_9ACTN|nr:TetR/AcrR family transcriptional regulator [Streptomyces hoynatensis]RKN46734.1 TetR/AcrR family transcriptional regulator [Streptomyces hoynatensis]
MAKDTARKSAAERRESVIRAAITEFGRSGYAGTSTAAIARRVGVSQPYLFRLFADKRAIFLAAAARCTDEIRQEFEKAAGAAGPEEAGQAMGNAYLGLIGDRDRLMFQMQMYIAAHGAEAAGDHEFGEELRGRWADLLDAVHLALGADPEVTGQFMAHGMLINVLMALGFPGAHHVWRTCGFGEDVCVAADG